jgi:hypothetical protein
MDAGADAGEGFTQPVKEAWAEAFKFIVQGMKAVIE